MKYLASLMLLFLLSLATLQAQQTASVEVIKYQDLEEIMRAADDKVKVINFWATWCRPCVKELPHFEALQKEYSTDELQVYLISFDDVEHLDSRVKPFINKKNITSTVKLLDETDYNAFIDKVDASWSGAIPATLIIAGENRKFVEGELSEAALNDLVQEVTK